jgi:pimeloyl-ACP methyl ester carboxylesterase
MVSQRVNFCTSSDGVRIAYAKNGAGRTLIRAPHWLTHIDYDHATPVRRHWLEELSRSYSVVRFDPRGCGLSDRSPRNLSLDWWVKDLEAVVDAAGPDRFALFGPSQGAAVAIEYAARHPERVTHLVLLGAFIRGKLVRDATPELLADAETQLKLIELGWGSEDPSYRLMFATQFMPTASQAVLHSFSEVMQRSAAPQDAARLVRMFYSIDVRDAAAKVCCPTLVVHARGDRRVPFEEGRLVAATIPGARFVALNTINHMLPEEDPSWGQFLAELRAFLPPEDARAPIAGLTRRETQILEELAHGLDNAQIAARLCVSQKTVRNSLTRIFDKLQVKQRGQAIVRARQAGFGLD